MFVVLRDLGPSKVKVEPMTWPSVEASRISHRRLNMHAQVACVVEQAWIPHKRCSIGKDKSRLRSDEATKPGRKIYMGHNSPQG